VSPGADMTPAARVGPLFDPLYRLCPHQRRRRMPASPIFSRCEQVDAGVVIVFLLALELREVERASRMLSGMPMGGDHRGISAGVEASSCHSRL